MDLTFSLNVTVLTDVYIPLTRIDAALHDQPGNNMDSDTEQNNIEDSTEDLGLEGNYIYLFI